MSQHSPPYADLPAARSLARRPELRRCPTPIGRGIVAGVVASMLSVLLACDARKDPEAASIVEQPNETPARVLAAPAQDGSLYVLGNDVACLEFTLDPTAGELVLRVWNAKRTKLMRLPTQWVEIQLAPNKYGSGTPARGNMTLLLMADPTSWENSHHAGQFSAVAPRLRDLKSFVAIMGELKLHGINFAGVEIDYPANEIVYTQDEDG